MQIFFFQNRVGLPSDYFEGVIEKFDPANPEKEGKVPKP
jgi:hypothetical protein